MTRSTAPSSRRTSLVLAAVALVVLSACGGGGAASTGATTPDAVANLAAWATGPTSISLTWTSPAGTLTGFEVERAASSGGPFSATATPPASATGYGDQGLSTDATYFYRVRALGAAGASPWSATAQATTSSSVTPAAPAAPSGLQVVPQGAGSLTLSWTDNASDETSFEVERADGGSTFFVSVATPAANATGVTDTGLAAAHGYSYRVRARNAVGPSAFTDAVTGTTASLPPPAAPTGFTAAQELVDAGGGTYSIFIRLHWTDAATDETGYELQRSSDDRVTWTATETLPAGSVSLLTTGASLKLNIYRLRAVSGWGPSAWVEASVFNGAMAIPGFICQPPTSPGVTATSGTTAHVTWAYSTSCGQTAIERATSAGGPFAEVARDTGLIFPFVPAFDDTGLAPGATYYYRLRSFGYTADWRSSGYTTTVSTTTPAPVTVTAPSGLSAAVTSGSTATLAWTDASSNEDGFGVEAATAAAGPFTQVFRVAAGVTQAFVSGMSPGTAYWFRVVALQGALRSAPSNVVALTTAATATFRTTFDTSLAMSTADNALQGQNFPSGPNDVGCFYIWTVDLNAKRYYFHTCGGSALRFDVSALAGKTILSAALSMYACALAPDPASDANYVVRAINSGWQGNLFNAVHTLHVEGGWALPAPTSNAQQRWDVTTIVQNWASGAWANDGLFVEQSPINDLRSFVWGNTSHPSQDQTTSFCSLEVTGGSIQYAPALIVDYR